MDEGVEWVRLEGVISGDTQAVKLLHVARVTLLRENKPSLAGDQSVVGFFFFARY